MKNGFIDIVLFGYKIGSIANSGKKELIHPHEFTLKINGRNIKFDELKYKLIETETDAYYELDFVDLLKQLK